MKKRILIGLLAIVALFSISGCGNKCKDGKCEKKSKTVISINPKATIGDEKVVFSIDAKLNELSFKHVDGDTTSNDGTTAVMERMKDNSLLYRITVKCYEDTEDYEVDKGSSVEKASVKIQKNYWKLYEEEENGKTVKTFIYTYNHNTYTIKFESDYEYEEFYNRFLDTLKF